MAGSEKARRFPPHRRSSERKRRTYLIRVAGRFAPGGMDPRFIQSGVASSREAMAARRPAPIQNPIT